MSAALVRIVFTAVVVVAALWYVTAPPKGVDGYRERLASTTETLRSQVQIARIWAEALTDDKATKPAALVGFRETESDAQSAISEFQAHEPPSGVLGLRAEFVSLSAHVLDPLSALRIAAEQERWDEVGRIARPLPGLAERLRAFENRASP